MPASSQSSRYVQRGKAIEAPNADGADRRVGERGYGAKGKGRGPAPDGMAARVEKEPRRASGSSWRRAPEDEEGRQRCRPFRLAIGDERQLLPFCAGAYNQVPWFDCVT